MFSVYSVVGFQIHRLVKRAMFYIYRMDYSCKICLKTFSQLRSLRRHERSIHVGKRFQCDQSFTQEDDLKRYQKQNQGMIAHTCSNCRKEFYRRDKLVEHQVHCQGNSLKRKRDEADSGPATKKG